MKFAQAYLTTLERDKAIETYRKRGATVKPDGQRALIVLSTRWIDSENLHARYQQPSSH
ncbi:hypothetical protein [Aeromonas sobria]|uniref:hypothetical protein n=1 Tax=Aeromonas sobria TaxID=646 RepID=UPI0016524185|nr:hypothetical protein [Aeromonas sobria]